MRRKPAPPNRYCIFVYTKFWSSEFWPNRKAPYCNSPHAANFAIEPLNSLLSNMPIGNAYLANDGTHCGEFNLAGTYIVDIKQVLISAQSPITEARGLGTKNIAIHSAVS